MNARHDPSHAAVRRAGGLALCLVAAVSAMSASSCVVLKAASSIDDVFMSEEDTALAAAALPVLIKGSEAILEASPKDQGAIVQAASLYVMYGSAFVQGAASALPAERFEEKTQANRRAAALFMRALRILEPALERRAPGSVAVLLERPPLGSVAKPTPPAAVAASTAVPFETDPGKIAAAKAAAISKTKASDVPLLYWTAAALLARFSIDPLDLEYGRALGAAPALLDRAELLSPGWNGGAVDEIRVSFYAGVPDYMGGGLDKAEAAWNRAVKAAGGPTPSLLVAYADAICVPKDDYRAWKKALEQAIDPSLAVPRAATLASTLARDRARLMLSRAEEYFIVIEGDEAP